MDISIAIELGYLFDREDFRRFILDRMEPQISRDLTQVIRVQNRLEFALS